MILKTEVFEGPFDLLLHLIRKNEINIADIPISQLADQYISYVESMFAEMNSMSEFVLMAATLLEIKSKMLLPRVVLGVPDDETDPREELVRRLIEYKRIKTAAEELKGSELSAEGFFYKPPDIELISELKKALPPVGELLKDVGMDSLFALYTDVMSRKAPSAEIEARFNELMKTSIYSVREKMTEITDLLHLKKEISLEQLLHRENRSEKIAVFLAVLELVKIKDIVLKQAAGKDDYVCIRL